MSCAGVNGQVLLLRRRDNELFTTYKKTILFFNKKQYSLETAVFGLSQRTERSLSKTGNAHML